MGKKEENAPFVCINCHKNVLPCQNGTFRNHCPFCLVSIHVDNVPGDRKNSCHGLMRPRGLDYKSAKGFQIIHKCIKCGQEKKNKVVTDDPQPDDWELIVSLSIKIAMS